MEQILEDFCKFCSFDNSKINEFLKQKNNVNSITIYTDGACSCNGKMYAKGGIGIYFSETNECLSENINVTLKQFFPNLKIEKPTNQKAELIAILKAIIASKEYLEKKIQVNIKTDSMYCVNIFTKWYKAWEKNNWKTASGKPVLNKEIIQTILDYTKAFNIKITYVPAHKTQPTDKSKYQDWYGNKKADELAVKAIS